MLSQFVYQEIFGGPKVDLKLIQGFDDGYDDVNRHALVVRVHGVLVNLPRGSDTHEYIRINTDTNKYIMNFFMVQI